MTPQALAVLTNFIDIRKRAKRANRSSSDILELDTAIKQIRECKFFDISGIMEIVGQEAEIEMNRQMPSDFLIDHGGLFFLPAENTWMEAAFDGKSIWFQATDTGDVNISPEEKTRMGFEGTIRHIVAGICVNNAPDSGLSVNIYYDDISVGFGLNEGDTHSLERVKPLVLVLVLSLMLMNAPKGVKREEARLPREKAKNVFRKQGVTSVKYHKIILDLDAGDVSSNSMRQGVSTPRAFHFCRSHKRVYKTGAAVTVKGHWRGNPAFGILRGDYDVRSSTNSLSNLSETKEQRTLH